MDKNRVIFVIIVGSAALMMLVTATWFRVQNVQKERAGLSGTNTAIALRATELSVSATDVAEAAMTADALYGAETAIAEAEQSLEATTKAISGETPSRRAQTTKEGLQIEILSVTRDAWRVIQAHNQFNDPPLEGRRMVMVKVNVVSVAGKSDEPLGLEASDFRMMGSSKRLIRPMALSLPVVLCRMRWMGSCFPAIR